MVDIKNPAIPTAGQPPQSKDTAPESPPSLSEQFHKLMESSGQSISQWLYDYVNNYTNGAIHGSEPRVVRLCVAVQTVWGQKLQKEAITRLGSLIYSVVRQTAGKQYTQDTAPTDTPESDKPSKENPVFPKTEYISRAIVGLKSVDPKDYQKVMLTAAKQMNKLDRHSLEVFLKELQKKLTDNHD
jgi:hypothetical protein